MEEKQNIGYSYACNCSNKIKNFENSSYAIIPATVLYNKDLKSNQKLLYAIISSLSSKEGYCYATNRYLAEKLGVEPNTVSCWITNLKRKEFIKVELIRNEKNQIKQRKIYINDAPYKDYKVYPYNIKNVEGILKKSKGNNNINNNILSSGNRDKMFSYISNKKNYQANYEQREYSKEFLENWYAN